MNLRQLEVFVAVIETGSFSRGALATSLTQSTVSQHIAALEDEAGLRLLDRGGRGVLPTQAGKLYLRHARRVLAECRALRTALDSHARGENKKPSAVVCYSPCGVSQSGIDICSGLDIMLI